MAVVHHKTGNAQHSVAIDVGWLRQPPLPRNHALPPAEYRIPFVEFRKRWYARAPPESDMNKTLRLTARQIRESIALYVRVHGYPAAVDDVTLLHDPERHTVLADVRTTVVDPPPTPSLPTMSSSATP